MAHSQYEGGGLVQKKSKKKRSISSLRTGNVKVRVAAATGFERIGLPPMFMVERVDRV